MTRPLVGIDSWLRWLPPGLAAHAIQDASDGHPGTVLLRRALLAAIIVALGWLWIRLLSRALVTADTTTQSSGSRRGDPGLQAGEDMPRHLSGNVGGTR